MMGILKKLSSVAKNRTTYRAGLLQAKAYRILKQKTAEILKPYGITTFEWAFVGLLADNAAMYPKDIASELGVERPFVTQMVAGLKKKGLVSETPDKADARAKTLSLTAKGKAFVTEVEPHVRANIRSVVAGIGPGDVMGYLSVLEKIVENDERKD